MTMAFLGYQYVYLYVFKTKLLHNACVIFIYFHLSPFCFEVVKKNIMSSKCLPYESMDKITERD